MRMQVLAVITALGSLVVGCEDKGGGGGNNAPEIDAGTDQSLPTASLVSLVGTATDEDEEDILTYDWSFFSLPAGSQAMLMNAETTTPSFVADVEGDYVLQFVVSDGRAVVADTVGVSAVGAPPENGIPVANAGPDGTAPVNGQFANDPGYTALDGSASSDPDGDYLFHIWTLTSVPDGSVALLDDPYIANPTLFVDKGGQYEISLVVTDGLSFSAPDTMIVDAAEADTIEVLTGDAQAGMVGTTLGAPLRVLVTNEFQHPIAGIAVLFDVTLGAGGDSPVSGIDHTEVDGTAEDLWVLGTVTGARTLTASGVLYIDQFDNATLLGSTDFDAMATSGPAVDFDLTVMDGSPSVDEGTNVVVTGFDLYGNQAADDDTTSVRLDVSGGALFADAANVGTVSDGGNADFVEITVDGGIADIDLDDTLSELVFVSLNEVNYSMTSGPHPIPSVLVDFPQDVTSFSFTNVFPPTASGTLTIEARGDFGGGGALSIFDGEVFDFYGDLFLAAPNCATTYSQESVTIPQGALADLNLDGQADFLVANFDGIDPAFCANNDFKGTLSFTGDLGAEAVFFGPGAVARIVLLDPVDVIAGDAMRLDAFSADQYGNPVFNDTAIFSIALSGTNATFAGSANDGVLVAGSGNKVWLRLDGGIASIDVNNSSEELVMYQLGDPEPATLLADDLRDGRFTGVPDVVVLLDGDAQTGTVGMPLPLDLLFEVRDASGFTIPGVGVSMVITTGGGSAAGFTSDRDGRGSTTFVLGTAPGLNSGFATVGATDAPFSAMGVPSTSEVVVLRDIVPPAAGSDTATVRIEVLDEYGNVVSGDSTTLFSVAADGSAVFTAVVTGTIVQGLGSPVVLVQAMNGIVELELTDLVDETVDVSHYDSLSNGLTYLEEGVGLTSVFDFDSGLAPWTQASNNGTVVWSADGTPSPVAGVSAAFISSPNSLNFNDGVDFSNGATVSGTATSPAVGIAGATTLTIECNYQTETTSSTSAFDRRTVQVLDAAMTVRISDRLGGTSTVPQGGYCAAMGTWHTHTYTLDPSWSPIRVRFDFNSGDSIANTGDGWFLDDVTIDGGVGNVTVTFTP